MIFKNKKGMGGVITILMGFIVVMIIGYFLINIGTGGISKFGGIFSGSLSETTTDSDGDGVKDVNDKCPCLAGTGSGEINGCPPGTPFADASAMKKEFNDNDPKCPPGKVVVDNDNDNPTLIELGNSISFYDLSEREITGVTVDETIYYEFTCSVDCVLNVYDPNNILVERKKEINRKNYFDLIEEGRYNFVLENSGGLELVSDEIVKSFH